jgi:peptidoglycan/xylan/chitin deacetylase (PgdA/CDA1 family)
MIGVIANPSQHEVVREFFELFKTPWEFYRHDGHYDIVLCADPDVMENSSAKLVLIYGGHELPFDAAQRMQGHSNPCGPRMLVAEGMRIPVYGESVTFAASRSGILLDEESQQAAAYLEVRANGPIMVRIGYDLFDEVTILLTEGQPHANAGIPSLDIHISFLRNLIVRNGIPLTEIPPVPRGYRFIACLTHDVDHPSLRLHRFDHTMFGFAYRALVGSALAALRGRQSMRTVLQNWAAVLKLPFVLLGLLPDFWNRLDTYTFLEGDGVRSSFFIIPFKHCCGANGGEPAPYRRASAYGAADIADEIRRLLADNHEIGLHGIDAWHDMSKGREELDEMSKVTGKQVVGVRIHWLYFAKESPAVLESLGVDYDSTVGYNEAVGYRAGTSQVYRPLGVQRLLELPLHIMDTALFFPARQNLSFAEARGVIGPIIDNAVQFGGVVTINWHDRSVAPERLWRDFYVDLIQELRSRGAWLASARDTVLWFRQRRAAVFEDIDQTTGDVNAGVETGKSLPGMDVRVHNASNSACRR